LLWERSTEYYFISGFVSKKRLLICLLSPIERSVGVGAGTFLGVRRKFARKKLFMSIRAPFFSNQSMFGTIFHHFFRVFVKVLQRFCPDFVGFRPDFHQIKTFEGAVASPPPTPVERSNVK